MLLAGDVGGTKTLLGIFDRSAPRPVAIDVRTFQTGSFDTFGALLHAFAADLGGSHSIDAAAIGVAGPVLGRRAPLTNHAWVVTADDVMHAFGTTRVALLNDLLALAHATTVLTPDELVVLQEGTRDPEGHAAVIAAGTGLGEAYLHRVAGAFVPAASEAGHADFAPRTDDEMGVARMLRDTYGRAELEQVVSGPGLAHLHRYTHRDRACVALRDTAPEDRVAAIADAALERRCDRCQAALDLFVSAYGAEAGNLALRGLATAGVYVGGGIAPKVLRALQTGHFMQAFRSKAPMTDLLSRIPVAVIRAPEAGLLGAAVVAAQLRAATPQ